MGTFDARIGVIAIRIFLKIKEIGTQALSNSQITDSSNGITIQTHEKIPTLTSHN